MGFRAKISDAPTLDLQSQTKPQSCAFAADHPGLFLPKAVAPGDMKFHNRPQTALQPVSWSPEAGAQLHIHPCSTEACDRTAGLSRASLAPSPVVCFAWPHSAPSDLNHKRAIPRHGPLRDPEPGLLCAQICCPNPHRPWPNVPEQRPADSASLSPHLTQWPQARPLG